MRKRKGREREGERRKVDGRADEKRERERT